MTESSESLLRSLSPSLRELGRNLRAWLDGQRHYPLAHASGVTLDGLTQDLLRQADALQQEKPLLVIMLMGGTGVGKSTLLNALAGGTIAHASFARPTTRDPVVYYHHTLLPQKLDPALRHCKLMVHDRPALEHKVIVDTPDLDSNDLANREKLNQLLPVADIVLYVGSQEKYHDQLGWELFLKHRQRRAFAFVLNKWDRCLGPRRTGLRPDEDLLNDLRSEGFDTPLLFRTCAQHWVDRLQSDGQSVAPESSRVSVAPQPSLPGPPEGEQFQELARWLEMGLTRLEIEAIKARGVSQLLKQAEQALAAAAPPDLTDAAAKTRDAWTKTLADEAEANTELLLTTLDPYQKEIEHHFALRRQQHFRGIMGTYLRWFNKMRYAGSSLRDRIPFLPRLTTPVSTPAQWDVAAFTEACSDAAADRHLDARCRALANRLLVEADHQGFPVNLLADRTENAANLDWRSRFARALVETLNQVEEEWTEPRGPRRWLHGAVVLLADWLPLLALAAMGTILLWQYTMEGRGFGPGDLVLLLVVPLLVMILLHIVIAVFLPMRWPAIRGEFRTKLEGRLRQDLEREFQNLPSETAEALQTEREKIEQLQAQAREIVRWLTQREQTASIGDLYGK
jgi:energy-coupling factor transporter ATP-binding protein EcfA2